MNTEDLNVHSQKWKPNQALRLQQHKGLAGLKHTQEHTVILLKNQPALIASINYGYPMSKPSPSSLCKGLLWQPHVNKVALKSDNSSISSSFVIKVGGGKH